MDRGASDVHIKAGDVVRARIDGRLVGLTKQALSPEQTRAIAAHLIGADHERVNVDTLLDHDTSWSSPGVGRFRVNILRQRASHSIVMRVIPDNIPTFESLRLPATLGTLAHAERGMVLVTGVTGSGKSSTMAAFVNEINANYEKHILTLENPIEFLHTDIRSSVTQREIGIDTDSFRMGLRAALRQDPDVILIGEMRDAETVDTAMKAAETGHLLVSTLHTPDAQSTIMRIVAMFAPDEQNVVRIRLAESLRSVVSQRLLPRASGQGRVVAAEVMVVTPTIRDLIIENRVSEVRDYIADGSQYGMQTFDQHLAELVHAGEVEFEVALAASTRPADFELGFRMGRNTMPSMPAQKSGTGMMAAVGAASSAGARGGSSGAQLAGGAAGAAGADSALAAAPASAFGNGPRMPPLAQGAGAVVTPVVSGAGGAVTSPSPLGMDTVFGSGFESLFGG